MSTDFLYGVVAYFVLLILLTALNMQEVYYGTIY